MLLVVMSEVTELLMVSKVVLTAVLATKVWADQVPTMSSVIMSSSSSQPVVKARRKAKRRREEEEIFIRLVD